MDITTYAIEHQVEQTHWWFCGRRYLFEKIIKSLKLSSKDDIVDIGSSAGTNLRLLKSLGFSNYKGMDISPESQKFCHEKKLGEVILSDIQTQQLQENKYKLVLATDILEHLEQDNAALHHIFDGLQSKRHALITVPCFQSLWGPQDIVSNHLRRYNKKDIETKIKNAGFIIEKSFYFNFLLFLPIFMVRKLLIKKNKIVNENEINSPFINFILRHFFKFDCFISSLISPPFGVSALILARKP